MLPSDTSDCLDFSIALNPKREREQIKAIITDPLHRQVCQKMSNCIFQTLERKTYQPIRSQFSSRDINIPNLVVLFPVYWTHMYIVNICHFSSFTQYTQILGGKECLYLLLLCV